MAIAGVVSTQVLEQWNGTGWLTLTNPTLPSISALESVSCVTMSWCTAVGLSSTSTLLGHVDSNLVEQWNGTAWSVVTAPANPTPYSAALTGVSCATVNLCVAVRRSDADSSGTAAAELATYDGTGWSGTPAPSSQSFTELVGADCLSGWQCVGVGGTDGQAPSPRPTS